jgi:hypothetical protein
VLIYCPVVRSSATGATAASANTNLSDNSLHPRMLSHPPDRVLPTDTCTAASPYSVGPSPVDSNGTEIEDEPAPPAYHGMDDEDEEPNSAAADTSGSGIISPVSAQEPVCCAPGLAPLYRREAMLMSFVVHIAVQA